MKRLFSWSYNFALLLLALIALPPYLLRRKKLISALSNKWGKGFEAVHKGINPLIWIHAVSVGETKAIAKLALLLKQRNPHAHFLITSVTETGQAEAKRSLPFADHFLYLPFDFSWVIRPIVKRLQPDLLLLSETDYWYHFVDAAKKAGAQIALVNGKLSEKSFKRYCLIKRWVKHYFNPVDLFILQSQRYAERFLALGIPSNKIAITGNLKLDTSAQSFTPEERFQWLKHLGIDGEDLVLVAGSTHATEETLILDAFAKLAPEFPKLKLLIAPRHPERFLEVHNLIQRYPFSSTLYTQAPHQAHIILIDAMGLLQKCYQIATVSIVGGSFTPKIGGHNILEPSAYGIPVLFGPYMRTQADFVELITEYQAGQQIAPQQLTETLRALLHCPDKRQRLGKNGIELTHVMRGASVKTCALLEELFQLSNKPNFQISSEKRQVNIAQ